MNRQTPTPDRPFTATVTLADGAQLTTTIHAPNPTAAEDIQRTPMVAGRAVSRIIVRAVQASR